MSDSTPIRVAIVDDDPIVRSAVASYVATSSDLNLVAIGSDGNEASGLVVKHEVDVLIMDIRMPGMDGIAATAEVRRVRPSTAILLLTSIDGDDEVRRGLAAGAGGFLLKDVTPLALVQAVRSVHVGNPVVSSGPLLRMMRLHTPVSPGVPLRGDLSGRERDILALLCQGASNAEIAETLFLAESTVKTHVSAVMAKLSATSRMKAVARAFELGLVDRR
ncbi:MAG: response regulator transcription factor [Propionibacteriaceae bacterium]|nr:response regulator transcription factor [Micropruina sp.]HBX82523.1 DNA-binding response regulator [Propionibacteriaceae bacterium]HBY22325.1 DNA-binding response regulator [Propionibacteriaceae bacterium]